MLNTSQDVYDAYRHLNSSVYNSAHRKVREWDKLVDQVVDCKQPKGEPSDAPPIGLEEMKKSVNGIFSDNFSLAFSPNETQSEKTKNEKLDKVIKWINEENNRENGNDIGRELAWDLSRGAGWVKGPFINYQALKDEGCPFTFHSVDLLTIFADPLGRFVIEATERYAGEIEEDVRKWNEKWRLKNGKLKKTAPYSEDWKNIYNDYEKLIWVEYYSPTKRMFLCEEPSRKNFHQLSEMQKNRLGYIPYSGGYSGWGMGKKRGKVEDRMVGRLRGMENAITVIGMIRSVFLGFARYKAWPMMAYPESAKEAFEDRNFEPGPGKWFPLPDEVMPGTPAGPKQIDNGQLSPELAMYMSIVSQDTRGLGGSDALLGLGSSEESGLKQMTRIRQSALDFGPPIRSYENIYSELFTKVIMLLGNDIVIPAPIKLWGKETLNPADVDIKTRVKYKSEFVEPQKDREALEVGLRMLERGVITRMEMRELYAKLTENDTYYSRMIAEQMALADPTLRSVVGQQYLIENGYMPSEMGVNTGDQKQQTVPENSEQRLKQGSGMSPVDTRRVGAQLG